MKIVVISDSHGNYTRVRRIIEAEHPFDALVHCGDGVGDLFHADLPRQVTVVKVPGNVDLSRVHDMERVIVREFRDRRIMVTHGDLFGAREGYDGLLREGRNRGADFVLFGHTHQKFLLPGSPLLFNPGPATNGVYGVITVGEEWKFEHRYLEG